MLEPAKRKLDAYLARAGLRPSLTAKDFATHRVTNHAQSEIIRNTLYDSLIYVAAGTTSLSFFQTPVGQGLTSSIGTSVATNTKFYTDTNMELAGQLPSGKQFLAESIEVLFLAGSVSTANTYTQAALSVFNAANSATLTAALNDINAFYQSGWLEFNILSKNYLREQMMKFPPKAMLQVDAAMATTSATAGEVAAINAKVVGRPYYLDPKVTLMPAMNFDVTLRWPGLVPTPSTFNGRVVVTIDGAFMRASQ
jgi:hypothetical protein